MRFPELSAKLRARGADILTYPSAFTVSTGEAHWETLLRARAIENQCYVVAAAQVGVHNPKRSSYGHAMASLSSHESSLLFSQTFSLLPQKALQ
jgi:predicted amidohydrolase